MIDTGVRVYISRDLRSKLFDTLDSKLLNFIRGRCRYVGSEEAKQYIKKEFPSWQYNGAAPFEELLDWCEQHFGDDWIWEWETIYFKHEKDLVFFKLRWA